MEPTPHRSKTRKELFERIRAVIAHGSYDIPGDGRYHGTGAPGMFLEDLLCLTAGSLDIPDSVGFELKWYTSASHLMTLFHKEADGPEAIMRYMVRKHGWPDKHGRLSFRHTIKGKSDRFRVEDSGGQVVVRPINGNGPVPYWSHNSLVSAAGTKLGKLMMVRGVFKKNERQVDFRQADAYQEFNLIDFIAEILRGEIAIDFDCRESKPGSAGLRNHGTKFRVAPASICRLYMKKERL